MKYIFVIVCIFYNLSTYSQNEFDVTKIKSAIKENANAVIRLREEIFTIKTLRENTITERLVVTIFNEKGEKEFSSFSKSYYKFLKIKKIGGFIYDNTGKKIRSLSKSDIKDYSAFDGAGEVTDSRQKIVFFDKKKYPYPYTIEFFCSEESSNGMFYPVWCPVLNEHIGIEKSIFSVIKPSQISFRYKEIQVPNKVEIFHTDFEDTYTWVIESMPPIEFEDFMDANQLPSVHTAPNDFEVDSYAGNASSWKNIGLFYRALNLNRDKLPETVKEKVKLLVQDEPDTIKKIKILYDYMQLTKRYISIQLGIGGWQVMKADEVAEKGYGDCKALSNFMIALLKEAGIKANPALIIGGNNYQTTQSDFPSFKFNHLIACVPLYNDTIWLECTSQTNAMGYMGSFTGNRKALLINDEGGTLVNTVLYSPKDNRRDRKTIVQVFENGNAEASVRFIYTGITQEQPASVYHFLNNENQKQEIISSINLAEFELEKFSFKEYKERVPKIEENLALKITNIVSKSGTSSLITPHLFSEYMFAQIMENDRKHSFYLNPNLFNYSVSDTVIYNFSNEVVADVVPLPVFIKTHFGEYTASVIFKDNQLIYCRNFVVVAGRYPNTEYIDWVKFIKQVDKNDRQKAIFVLKSK